MQRKKCFYIFILQISLLFFQSSDAFATHFSKDTLFSHRYSNYTKLLSPEKLYLHTDKTQYAVGDTIWFKGYLLNNSFTSDYPESNYLYVELIIYPFTKEPFSGAIQEEAQMLKRIKVKRREGILQGYIPIDDDCVTGSAILRGYTYWNLNQPYEYVSYKNITILNPIKDKYFAELKEKNERTPEIYLSIGMQSPFKAKEKPRDLSCVFLPESGRYIVGKRCAIGIKSIDETGFGLQVTGTVYDKSGAEVTSFSTNEYGFAKIFLTPSSSEELYTAKISDDRGLEKIIKLPKVETQGVVISMQRRGANLISEISSSSDYNKDSLQFLLCNGTEIFYSEPVSKVEKLAIPVSNMAVGINNAIVVDSRGNILAKRPFFVMPTRLDSVKLTTNKERYGKRDMVRGKITLSRPVAGDFSISVTDDELSPYDSSSSNILTHMLLGSELKGYLENPSQYFNKDIPMSEREESLDMLLITQGWEYYDLPKILKGEYASPKYGREYIQSVAGQVKRSIFRKKKESRISFVAPKINFAAMGDLDEEGYFELKDIDFPDSTQFIVNATDIDGKNKRSFYPTVFDDTFAGEVDYIRPPKNRITYSPKVAEVLTNRYYNNGGTQSYTLNTITVYGKKKLIPGLSPISELLFNPSDVREKKDILLYSKYDVDLLTYLIDTYNLKWTVRNGHRIIYTNVVTTPSSRMQGVNRFEVVPVIYVNGRKSNVSELEGYMLNEIEAVAFISHHRAASYSSLFSEAEIRYSRSIVLVKTKLRTISFETRNITSGIPLGWQKPKYFYSPQYDVKKKNTVETDSRSTIYWNPSLGLNEVGEASFKFYTSDGSANYTVVIEGITADGEYVFSKHKIERE